MGAVVLCPVRAALEGPRARVLLALVEAAVDAGAVALVAAQAEVEGVREACSPQSLSQSLLRRTAAVWAQSGGTASRSAWPTLHYES